LATNQSDCNVPCPGYNLDFCGGVGAVSVFKAEGAELPSASLSSSSSSPLTTAPPAANGTVTRGGGVLTTTSSVGGARRNLAILGW